MADAAPRSADDLRAELQRLGGRRARLKAREEELSEDAEKVLRESFGVISVAEASRLLGIHRTTVYRVYHPHEQRSDSQLAS